jgi:hypothetical protein
LVTLRPRQQGTGLRLGLELFCFSHPRWRVSIASPSIDAIVDLESW